VAGAIHPNMDTLRVSSHHQQSGSLCDCGKDVALVAKWYSLVDSVESASPMRIFMVGIGLTDFAGPSMDCNDF
jgi:hypothetical protein